MSWPWPGGRNAVAPSHSPKERRRHRPLRRRHHHPDKKNEPRGQTKSSSFTVNESVLSGCRFSGSKSCVHSRGRREKRRRRKLSSQDKIRISTQYYLIACIYNRRAMIRLSAVCVSSDVTVHSLGASLWEGYTNNLTKLNQLEA